MSLFDGLLLSRFPTRICHRDLYDLCWNLFKNLSTQLNRTLMFVNYPAKLNVNKIFCEIFLFLENLKLSFSLYCSMETLFIGFAAVFWGVDGAEISKYPRH